MLSRPPRPGAAPAAPAVSRRRQEGELPLQVGIPETAGDAVAPEHTGEPRRPSRRLAGLGRRRWMRTIPSPAPLFRCMSFSSNKSFESGLTVFDRGEFFKLLDRHRPESS